MPTGNWWDGAIGVALLGLLWQVGRRVFAAYTKNSSSWITDQAQFRAELVALIQKQWVRIQEQDKQIAEMHAEVMTCEEKHLQLTARHERLVVAVRKWVPKFEFEEEDKA